jgi:molybdate transport system permease protein
MRRAFDVVLVGATALVLAFLLLPIVALFLRITPSEMLDALTSEVALDALWVTIKTGLVAHVFVLLVGTPAAYLIATRRFRGRNVVITAIELPLVLPPAVAGIGLLALFARRGLLGETVDALGIAAFEGVDPALLEAAHTLGAGPARTFGRVAVPLARNGLGAGSALAWARGTGEFGATIMFAGSLQGVTQTLPLAIYAQLDIDPDTAIAIGAFLVLLSLVVLLTARLLRPWHLSTSVSATRSAASA